MKKYGDYNDKIKVLERQLNEKKNSKSNEVKRLKDDLTLWESLKEQRDYLNDLLNAVEDARQMGLTLEQAKLEIRLEKYKSWLDYDRIGLDIEACWAQIGKTSS